MSKLDPLFKSLLIAAVHEIGTVQGTHPCNDTALIGGRHFGPQHMANVLVVQDLFLGSEK